ncbi:MAG TPA: hypothetical protein VK217_03590, partial [Acidimicrobiales bacterium]|nr:hypothetical protein [Acidimicrobiales bacterium]
VNFKLQKTGFCFGSGCTFTGSAPLNASGVATFAQGGLSSGTAYTITVTYAGNATYQSSSASGSGTPT